MKACFFGSPGEGWRKKRETEEGGQVRVQISPLFENYFKAPRCGQWEQNTGTDSAPNAGGASSTQGTRTFPWKPEETRTPREREDMTFL